ncbi:recombinase family protein [Streptomyces sp. UNOB3_S3]|uniref:recombinase family protein n=1 Tax=Streptomyces sp. UNOB3_S3 TaxID=2871682 RepID=UPI001E323B2B|nr:recombinase family protein [Streptomyces sp. UNOB3_S3]MCC3775164.1 recombinase family protein [Streptomyces sp. UNOB3_S3]
MGKQRLIGVIRLSKETDESTSPQVQRRAIKAIADLRGAEIVGWASDLDVSATDLSPAERPELAKWLARPDEWDGLAFWRLDRFVRSVIDFADMIRWCRADGRNKNMISATEPIDLKTPIGVALAQIIVVFAELEASTIKLRVLAGRAEKRSLGRWSGGEPSYGYKTVPARSHVEGCDWHACDCPQVDGLQIDFDDDVLPGAIQTAYATARELVDRVLGPGDSMNSVCLDYEDRDILAPSDHKRVRNGKPIGGKKRRKGKRAKWGVETVRNILLSPTLQGYMSHDGEIVCGDDGMPIRVGPAMVTDDEARRLRIKLVDEQSTRTRTKDAAPLLDVGFCDCGHKLHHWRAVRKLSKGPKLYRYYRCGNPGKIDKKKVCNASALDAHLLESLVSAYVTFPSILGDIEVERKILVPGEDHTAELTRVREAIQRLTDEKDKAEGWDDEDEAIYASRMAKLREKRKALAKLPQRADEWRWEGTGETYAELWERSDWDARRKLLINGAFTVVAYRPVTGRGGASGTAELQILMCPGPDLAKRLQGRELPKLPPTLEAPEVTMALSEAAAA